MVQNNYEPALVQGKIMSSHNAKTGSVMKNESVRTGTEKEDVRVIDTSLVAATEFTISEDCDRGSDPYNSTGQHVIIKPKVEPED